MFWFPMTNVLFLHTRWSIKLSLVTFQNKFHIANAGVEVGGNGKPFLVEAWGQFSMKGSKQLPVEQWLAVATWCHTFCYGVIWAWVPSLLLNSWTPTLLLSPTAADHILNSGLALFLLIWLLFHSRHSHTQLCDICCIIVKVEDVTTHQEYYINQANLTKKCMSHI